MELSPSLSLAPSLALSLTFRTIVSRGCKLARPPGGSVEQPVVNCRKAFRSSHDIPHKTLTNRRKPGLERAGHQLVNQQRVHCTVETLQRHLPVSGVAQLGLSVVDDIISCPGR